MISHLAYTSFQVPEVAAPAPTPILTDIVTYYDVNNASSWPGSGTTISDLSGNGYNASMNNSLPVNTTGGISYLDWDSSYNTRQLNTTWNSGLNFASAGAVTGEVWTYLNSFSLKDGEGHFLNVNVNGSHCFSCYQLIFRYTSANLEVFIGNTTGWGQKFSQKAHSGIFSTGEWMQLAFTYSTSDYVIRMYHNGSLIFTSSPWTAQPMVTAGASSAFHTGNGLGTSAQVAARIAIQRTYNAVLSDDDILNNYNADKSFFGL